MGKENTRQLVRQTHNLKNGRIGDPTYMHVSGGMGRSKMFGKPWCSGPAPPPQKKEGWVGPPLATSTRQGAKKISSLWTAKGQDTGRNCKKKTHDTKMLIFLIHWKNSCVKTPKQQKKRAIHLKTRKQGNFLHFLRKGVGRNRWEALRGVRKPLPTWKGGLDLPLTSILMSSHTSPWRWPPQH